MANPPDEQLKAYELLCTSYHAIDDFRAKLLGFLPLVSGSGVFLLLSETLSSPEKHKLAQGFLYPIGLFGFVVTLGLFFYELYGILKCHALINEGKHLECLLQIEHGQFKNRPRSILYLINEPLAAGVIYPAVLAAWAFLASIFPPSKECVAPETTRALTVATRVFIVGFVFTLTYNLMLGYGRSIFERLTGKKAIHTNPCG